MNRTLAHTLIMIHSPTIAQQLRPVNIDWKKEKEESKLVKGNKDD